MGTRADGARRWFSIRADGSSLRKQVLRKLERLGAVREVPFTERARAVADLYREMIADSSRRILVVAPTHEEIDRATRAIRNDLSGRGHLGKSVMMDRFIPLQWTEAQKRDFSNYREGQILLIHRDARGMDKHEALTVSRAAPETLVAHNARGEERTFKPTQTVPSLSMRSGQSMLLQATDCSS